MDSFTLEKVEFDRVRQILAEYCRCSLGRRLAERITPSRNLKIVTRWLNQTSQMVQALCDHGLPPFGGITDIQEELSMARPGKHASAESFAQIASTLEGAQCVKAYLHSLSDQLEELRQLAGGIGDFSAQVEAIRRIVGSDGTVLDDASPRLRQIRSEISSTSQKIHDVIHGYLRHGEVARLLQSAKVTLHGDRYVLPVKAENRGRLPGVVHRSSKTGATVFVEPTESVELNNHLVDLYSDERAEVLRLLNELSIEISSKSEEIMATLRMLAQVDLIAAKAQYAYQFEMICPEIRPSGGLQINRARHPLLIDQAYRQQQEGVSEDERFNVVPIDVRLGSDFDILVVTGSNTGGKTVTLKTVALLVIMAQSGMHIPAQRDAVIPLIKDVLIDIGDEQSLQQSLSTFGAHVKRLKHILHTADHQSLVLLDELGAGTDPDEGGAIGQAVLDRLQEVGCMAMVTTHLGVLKAYAVNHDRVDNASVEFDTQTLRPTYHLCIGTPGESHAITVAQRLGLGKQLVASARRHFNARGKQLRKALKATGQARAQAEEARAEAQQAKLVARDRHEEYEQKLEDLEKLQKDFHDWLVTLPRMQPGDEVFVPSLNRTCRLNRLQLHKQVAVVDSGSLQIEVPLRELMPDLGQEGVRRQLDELRRAIAEQGRVAQQATQQAEQYRDQQRKEVHELRQKQHLFEQWRNAVVAAKPGDMVSINRKPGKAKLVGLDWTTNLAKVSVEDQEVELAIADLFPQTGKYALKPRLGKTAGGKGKDQPLRHRAAKGKDAEKRKKKVLAVQPGQQVFVVPFRKRATLIRFVPDREQAIVQAGAFELEVPLVDLEAVEGG